MALFQIEDSEGKQSRAGRKYFDEFDMCFWKLSGKYEEFF